MSIIQSGDLFYYIFDHHNIVETIIHCVLAFGCKPSDTRYYHVLRLSVSKSGMFVGVYLIGEREIRYMKHLSYT